MDSPCPRAVGSGRTPVPEFLREWESWTFAQRRGRWVRHDVARVNLFLNRLPPERDTVESITTREVARFFRAQLPPGESLPASEREDLKRVSR